MATHILDLLYAIDETLLQPSGVGPADAAAALVQVERVVKALADAGLDIRAGGARETVAGAFALSCGTTGRSWPAEEGRCTLLVGVLGDTVGKLHDELTQSDRWSTVVSLGPLARRLARAVEASGPYEKSPVLKDLSAAISDLRREAARRPPDPNRCVGLKRPIPLAGIPAGLSAAQVACETMAETIDLINRRGRHPLTVSQMVSICRAGEALSAAARGPRSGHVSRGELAWGRARDVMSMLTDARVVDIRYDRLTFCAARVAEAASRVREAGHDALATDDRAAIRTAGDLLPSIAEALDLEIRTSAESMLVPKGSRPLREERVAEWLTNRTYVVTRPDLTPLLDALAAAEQASGRGAPRGTGLTRSPVRSGPSIDPFTPKL